MTNILSRQQRKLKTRGVSEDLARKISYFTQKNQGSLGQGYRLSTYGQRYSNIGSNERRKIRQKKYRDNKKFIGW